MMTLTIVMPTMSGRENELERTVAAYERLTPCPIEWVIERSGNTVAAAWNAGTAKATGTVLHCGNDDEEPETDLWLPAALAVLERDGIPVGWVREDVAGAFGRDFPRMPICMRAWWQPLDPRLHYWSDNQFGDLQAQAGRPVMVADGYDFYHRKSMVGRDESPERLARDRAVYESLR